MSLYSVLPPIVFLVLAIVTLILMTRGKFARRIIFRILFFIAVIGGFSFYTYAFLKPDSGFADTLFAALRGIVSTARMFILDPDYFELAVLEEAEWLTGNRWWLILFWLCHISALIVIQSALFYLFGRKYIDRFRMYFGLHREVYIIKGSNQNAIRLGENIATHDASQKYPDTNRLIVFLTNEEDDSKKTYEKVARFGGIVLPLDQNNNLVYCLRETGLGTRWRTRYRKNTKYNIVLMPEDRSASEDARTVVEYANRKRVSRENLDIFAIMASDWDREELESLALQKDKEQRVYPYTFHLASEVELSARQMVLNHPPFKCMAFDFNAGVTTHNFTVLILGFGEMGQHALLRLIMNGQFVGSRMQAIIIDKDANRLRDRFLYRHPSLDLCCQMKFQCFDVPHKSLHEFLNKTDNLDYVVIALDNGDMNKQAALDIRLHYERAGINIHKMPFIAIADTDGGVQKKKSDENIFKFGSSEDLYRESLIIREEIDKMAIAVNDTYRTQYGGKPWNELDWFDQESSRASADFIPAMLYLTGIDKNKAMRRDILTDNIALAEILAHTEHLRWNAFHAAMGWRTMNLEELRRRFELNSGGGKSLYAFRKDPVTRQHICLATWDELDTIKESYHDLSSRVNDPDKQKRDFKELDRQIIRSIPKFLRKAKGIDLSEEAESKTS